MVNVFMMSKILNKHRKQDESLFMQESAQNDRATILKDKSNILEQDTQNTNSSKILEVVSTSKEKDLTPYWNTFCQAMSKKWLWLTEIDCAALDLNLSTPLQTKTVQGSWFSTKVVSPLKQNLLEIYFPLSTFSPVEFTLSESTIVRSKKIRIYPKSTNDFNRYCGLDRYWFNQAVSYLKQDGTKASLGEVRKIQQTRQHPEWAFLCPQRIREHAMNDAVKAVKNAKDKFRQTGIFQEVHFRKKKNHEQRFGFDKKSLNDSFVFSKKGRVNFYATETIPEATIEGTKIKKENGRWFLIIPEERKVKIPETQRLPFVALDPGVRTFNSFFAPEVFGKLGEQDFQRIYRLCLNLDKLISRRSKAKGRSKYRMKQAERRLRWKIKDLIDDLHRKVAFFLVTRFDKIYLPTFETSQMVSKLRSKTARSMLTFGHYRFKEFLKAKAEEYSSEVIDTNEAYTSKTCSFCGKIQNIGSKERMKCSCGVNVDRDLNGARGILLRALLATT